MSEAPGWQLIASEWQRAFEHAHHKTAPTVTWEHGWFKIEPIDRRYRRAQLEDMTKVLRKGFTD